MNTVNHDIAGSTLHITQLLEATPEQVWAAWTRPEHLVNWWGPKGYTCTIHNLEFITGGEWLLSLQGPDGKRYPNKIIFGEIVPLQKIIFRHYNPGYTATVLFTPEGQGTRIDWTVQLETAENLQIQKAGEGLVQHIQKLEHYLEHAGNH